MKNILPLLINLIGRVSPRLAGRIVFSMFCKAKSTEVKSVERTIMEQAIEETITINGDRVVVYTWGNHAKTVLLVHGWESRASRFSAMVSRFLELGYRVVAFDAPGHGRSDGNTVTINEYFEIMRLLQGKYGVFDVIVAHSLGALKTFYSIKNGVKAKKLIAISSVCRFNYIIHRYASFFKLRDATVRNMEQRLVKLFGSDSIWEEFSVDYQADKIDCDVVLIHDRKDDFVEIGQSEKIKQALGSRAQLHVVQEVGHFRILSAPQVLDVVSREVLKAEISGAVFNPVLMPDSA